MHELLREHVVGARILLPGVAYTELVLASMLKSDARLLNCLTLVDIAFVRPCVITSKRDALEQFVLRRAWSSSGSFDISSRASDAQSAFTTHAMGKRAIGVESSFGI